MNNIEVLNFIKNNSESIIKIIVTDLLIKKNDCNKIIVRKIDKDNKKV
jgi:hypothetical protein